MKNDPDTTGCEKPVDETGANTITAFDKCAEPEQITRLEVLARSALEQWDLGAGARVELVQHRENTVFCVNAGGRRYALRVHRANYHSDAELASEFIWTRHLNSVKLRTPQPVPARCGALFVHADAEGVPETRRVDLLEWFEGRPLGKLEEWLDESPETLAPSLEIAGRLMGYVNRQARHWTPPAEFTRRQWDKHTLLRPDPFWGRYWELEALSREQIARLERAEPLLQNDLKTLGKDPDHFGIIHADFIPDNLLVDGETVCLIDFDDMGPGWYLYEMASLLFFFADHPDYACGLEAAVRGYRQEHTLSDDALHYLPVFLLLRGMAFLGWVHERSDTETAAFVTPRVIAIVDKLVQEYLR